MAAIRKGTIAHIRNINASPNITAATIQSFNYTTKPKIDDSIKSKDGPEIEDILDDVQIDATCEFAAQTGFDETTIAIGAEFTVKGKAFYIKEYDFKEASADWTKYTAKLIYKPGLGLVPVG